MTPSRVASEGIGPCTTLTESAASGAPGVDGEASGEEGVGTEEGVADATVGVGTCGAVKPVLSAVGASRMPNAACSASVGW